MAIIFILEDGTGKTDSTTYVSVAEFRQYFENRGKTFTEIDADIEPWLNEATTYADCNYQWSGVIFDEDQALEVPRSYWYNSRGVDISETVPLELKNGVSELAFARQGNPVVAKVIDNNVSSESFGTYSYTNRTGSQVRGNKTYPAADGWFKKLGLNDRLGRACRV
jgi:hypothetical protein